MRSARSTLLAATALLLATSPSLPEAAQALAPRWPRGPQPKQPDPIREAVAEAKRQRKAAKRLADALNTKGESA